VWFRKPFVRVPLEGSCFAEVACNALAAPLELLLVPSVSIGGQHEPLRPAHEHARENWRSPTDDADSPLVAGPSDAPARHP